ncbi:MAG: alpha/beta fold hydrolase [Promethearchaeota archaeon]
MPLAEVNNIKLSYEIKGEGFPLILINGFANKKETWVAQVGPLSEYFKVITYDLRSSGGSSRPEEPYTMETLVEDLKGLMDYLNINKANIVCQSMGGWIAQDFALKYPERLNKLVMIGSNHTGDGILNLLESYKDLYELRKEDPTAAFWKFIRFTQTIKFRKELESDLKKKIHGVISVEELIEESKINPLTPKDLENQAVAGSKHDSLDKLDQIKHETLIMAASKDKLAGVYVAEQMHEKMPNSTLKIFEELGHEFYFSNAPEVNEEIINFLK